MTPERDNLPSRAEQEPQRETIGRGELFCLYHPHTADTFSGYGLTIMPNRPDLLVGLLMVDRPNPADPAWLQNIEEIYGDCQLVPMTASGDRGLVCQMHIDPDSLPHLRRLPAPLSQALQEPLQPLLEELPAPALNLHWDEESRLWRSEFDMPNELPPEIREVFERSGYGCLAAESNRGIVHICHAPDRDIDGFRDRPVHANWQLIEMPTAPLIRLELIVHGQPLRSLPLRVLPQRRRTGPAAGPDPAGRAGGVTPGLLWRRSQLPLHDHHRAQRAAVAAAGRDDHRALAAWQQLPPAQRDYDLAKAAFMARYP